MKLFNVKDPEELLGLADQCKGTVELVSSQGDRLNLKSQLTKYIAVTKLFSDPGLIDELELVVHDPEDMQLFIKYMMAG